MSSESQTKTTPTPPEKILYEDVEPVIESIAENKARQFGKIAWLDREDIKQEVRLKCWKTLDKYDPRKADLYTFLSKCADNRIRDIRRGILYKHNKPCFRCPFWDSHAAKVGKHDCLEYVDKMQCDKYARHEKYVQTKLSANHPINIDENRVTDNEYPHRISQTDLIDYIYAHLPSYFVPLFDAFIESNFDFKALKPKERIIISEVIVDILEIYQEEIDD